MTPRNVHYSSDSSDSESYSASDSDTKVIANEDSEVQKLSIPKIEAKTADTKAPKPFSARMTPCNIHYSSDSSDSESNSASYSDTKVIAEEDSEVQKLTIPKIETKTADTKPPKPFSARMTPRNVHYSYFSDSDSEVIAEEEPELQKANSLKDTTKELELQPNAAPEEDKTAAEPKESLDLDPETQANKPVLKPKPTNPCVYNLPSLQQPTSCLDLTFLLHLFWLNMELNARQRLVIRILSEQRLIKNERLLHSFYV